MKNICVVGLGYVGMPYAKLFAGEGAERVVYGVDLVDKSAECGAEPAVRYSAELTDEIIKNTELFILAVPTNWSEEGQCLDCSILEKIIGKIREKSEVLIVIKSTINVGFTDSMNAKYGGGVVFSPEFLREGHEFEDCQNPSRIIIGADDEKVGSELGKLFLSITKKPCEILLTAPKEAEAVKLFSNAYLALRVSFFNEIDTYSRENNLNSFHVIAGMALDPRIGKGYNNPSFGFGGYCLPKDSLQAAKLINLPVAKAIAESNDLRIKYSADRIINSGFSNLHFPCLNFKNNSKNARESSTIHVIDKLCEISKQNVYITDPNIGADVVRRFEAFSNVKFVSENELPEEYLTVVNRARKVDIENGKYLSLSCVELDGE